MRRDTGDGREDEWETWRGGVVLVLADASTTGDLSCCPLREARDERSAVRYELVATRDDLRLRLAALGTEVIAVVLDPEVEAPDDRSALDLATQLLRTARDVRVILCAAVLPSAMHAVLRVLSHLRCELVVRGVDRLPDWTTAAAAKVDTQALPREALQQLCRLPSRFRFAWFDAMQGVDTPNVKRVVAGARVKRRTLERAHKQAGIWPPARLLRALWSDETAGSPGDGRGPALDGGTPVGPDVGDSADV